MNNQMNNLINDLIVLMNSGKTILVDVDQTVYDKGVWDVQFLNDLLAAGLTWTWATHGTTVTSKNCPVQMPMLDENTLETEVLVDADGMPMLNANDMPLCKKVVPDTHVLVDNMKNEMYQNDANVLYREFRV